MPFQLSIKHHLDESEHFAASRVESFEGGPVRVGCDTACECRIDSDEFAPVHFTLVEQSQQWLLRREQGSAVFLNQEPVEDGPALLHSGDEIRIGHWTVRFQIVHPSSGQAWRVDFMANAAKVLIGLILLAELFIVLWLPQRIRSASLWEKEIAQQRTILLLDQLRTETRPTAQGHGLDRAAMAVVAAELDQLARHVRTYESKLSRSQWRRIHDDLIRFSDIVANVQDDKAFPPTPAPELAAGVATILNQHATQKINKP